MVRKASVTWDGSGKDGKGAMTTQSGVLKGSQYGFSSRFEDGIGTNPEELIAAAHAGCYSMKLSFLLKSKNFISEHIETTCSITLEEGKITLSYIEVTAKVPGISMEEFQACALEAKENCPISLALNCEKTLKATLV
jgi:osmotically inducible protein OsmC